MDWLANKGETHQHHDFSSPWHKVMGVANLDPREIKTLQGLIDQDYPVPYGGDLTINQVAEDRSMRSSVAPHK